jgi:hypothetical protein
LEKKPEGFEGKKEKRTIPGAWKNVGGEAGPALGVGIL